MSDKVNIIKTYLISKNLSRKQFAEKLSISESYLSRVLNNKDDLTDAFLLNIKKNYQDIDIDIGIDLKPSEPVIFKKYTSNIKVLEMNLQLRRAKVWVINHRLQGLMVKEVVKQSKNIITCHSWNPIVSPFDLDLNEVNQLFYKSLIQSLWSKFWLLMLM